MDLDAKHLGAIALGIACIAVSVLVPATAPALAPLGGVLLLAANPKKAISRPAITPAPASKPGNG